MPLIKQWKGAYNRYVNEGGHTQRQLKAKKRELLARQNEYLDRQALIEEGVRLMEEEAIIHKKQVTLVKNEVIDKLGNTGIDTEIELYELWKAIRGQEVRFITVAADMIVRDNSIVVDDKYKTSNGVPGFRTWFIATYLNSNPSDNDWQEVVGNTIAMKPNTIERKLLVQAFRDGKIHCVFEPLLERLNTMVEKSKGKEMKQRTAQRIKAVEKIRESYNDGPVPEDKMDDLFKVAGLKCTVLDIIGKVYKEYGSGKNGVLVFKNSRTNHLIADKNHTECKVVSADVIRELYKEAKQKYKTNGDFYQYTNGIINGAPRELLLDSGKYKVSNPIRDKCLEYDNAINIKNYKICTGEKDKVSFLTAGCLINSVPLLFNIDCVPTGCADMPSAYTQYRRCKYYKGFPGLLHQFRSNAFDRKFVEEHLGYYRFTITGGVDYYMEKYGMAIGQQLILFSPEILYHLDCGLQVVFDAGTWFSTFDLNIPEDMITSKAYKQWAGRLIMNQTYNIVTIPGDDVWASHLKALGYDATYYKNQQEIQIKTENDYITVAPHIMGALTAYTRIQMMEAIKCFDPKNIQRVVLDGIYYCGEKPSELNWFSDKEVKDAPDYYDTWYNNCDIKVDIPPMSPIIRNTFLLGAGGTGKTHSIASDECKKGFGKILYVTPENDLGIDKNKEFGILYATAHNLLGLKFNDKKTRCYKDEHGDPAVILADEITKWDKDWVTKMFEMYPNSLIILAGDMDRNGKPYQCINLERDRLWKPENIDIIEYTQDMRSKDKELENLKVRVRQKMDEIKEWWNNGPMEMIIWAVNNLPLEKDMSAWKPGDIVIAGTHHTNRTLLQRGISSGYKMPRGGIYFEEVKGGEERGSFTIHSYQGKTEPQKTMWIVLKDMFDYAMLYTAISRCCYMYQLKFIFDV